MKPYIVIILMMTLTASLHAQYIPINHITESSDTATAVWDSTWIGSALSNKYIKVINSGSVDLLFCFENDTTSYITIKQNESFEYPYVQNVRFVRTKTSTTCIRRIRWGYR